MGLARLEEEEENQGEDDDKLLFAATTRFVCGHDLLLGQCHLQPVSYHSSTISWNQEVVRGYFETLESQLYMQISHFPSSPLQRGSTRKYSFRIKFNAVRMNFF